MRAADARRSRTTLSMEPSVGAGIRAAVDQKTLTGDEGGQDAANVRAEFAELGGAAEAAGGQDLAARM